MPARLLLSALAFFAALCLAAGQTNTIAQAKCRELHHVDADPMSEYGNSGCFLRCSIHGQTHLHQLHEGMSCPMGLLGTCHFGQCVQQSRMGLIDVEIISASLSRTANAYAVVCVQNSTLFMSLPIHNRASCVSCVSNPVYDSWNPHFNSVCANSGKHLFIADSRVSVELWDNHGIGATNKIFLGGVSLTIAQLLSQGGNHQELHLPITGGTVAGQMNLRITWTPK